MHQRIKILLSACILSLLASGCVVRTYPVVKERVDQDLEKGNRGYLIGNAPPVEKKDRKTTRHLQVFEVELHKVEVMQKPGSTKPEKKSGGSVYVPPAAEVQQPKVVYIPEVKPVVTQPVKSKVVLMKKYTIKKGDTLQSVSKKFYGTTRRWKEIFEVNQNKLKSPHSLYPGQVIEVPVEQIPGEK